MNLTVVTDLVSMLHGHVMEWQTVQMAQMKLTVVAMAVLMTNLTVAMDLVSMVHGHVTAMVTVQTALMKLTVLLHHVKIKDYGIVAMANVFHQVTFVMDQLIPVTQDGLLTVQMVQMKA